MNRRVYFSVRESISSEVALLGEPIRHYYGYRRSGRVFSMDVRIPQPPASLQRRVSASAASIALPSLPLGRI
jgi:hypothetical protein